MFNLTWIIFRPFQWLDVRCYGVTDHLPKNNNKKLPKIPESAFSKNGRNRLAHLSRAMLTRSALQLWNSIPRLLKVVPNGCFQASFQNIFALLSNNYCLPLTSFYLLTLLTIMQPRRARISGNLTAFLTVKVTGYNTGGPYMLRSIIHGWCAFIYNHRWTLLIPSAHLSNSGASSSQRSITGASHETRRIDDITHKFTVTQCFQLKQEEYDLTTDVTSQMNLPDGQRDTYFSTVLTISTEPLRSLPRISYAFLSPVPLNK